MSDKTLRAIGGIFIACLCAYSARADSDTPPLMTEIALNPFLSYAVPTNPMHAGVLETKLAAGTYSQNSKSLHARATGGSASAIYAFTEHWGVSALVGRVQMGGDSPINIKTPGNARFTAKGVCTNDSCADGSKLTGAGTQIGANVVWDYRSGDGFRLPVFIGASYLDADGTVDNSVVGLKRSGKVSSLAATLGIVPQFNVWKFRISPFILATYTANAANASMVDYNPVNGAVNFRQDFRLDSDDYRQTDALGASFSYRPWNLSFTYVFSNEGANSVIFAWSHKWAGS